MKISPRLFHTDRTDRDVQPAAVSGSFAAKDRKRP